MEAVGGGWWTLELRASRDLLSAGRQFVVSISPLEPERCLVFGFGFGHMQSWGYCSLVSVVVVPMIRQLETRLKRVSKAGVGDELGLLVFVRFNTSVVDSKRHALNASTLARLHLLISAPLAHTVRTVRVQLVHATSAAAYIIPWAPVCFSYTFCAFAIYETYDLPAVDTTAAGCYCARTGGLTSCGSRSRLSVLLASMNWFLPLYSVRDKSVGQRATGMALSRDKANLARGKVCFSNTHGFAFAAPEPYCDPHLHKPKATIYVFLTISEVAVLLEKRVE
ncbi:hypothetical protein LXG23DRAFT_39444 [Yarrowia lipolytica]|nr:hypothetical protein LXG23DRAFT_39444 [Yarrowia lipolytica]